MFLLIVLAFKATEGWPQKHQPQLRRNTDNCWALVDEAEWPRIINFDQATSTIRIFTQQTGPRVKRCLQGKLQATFPFTIGNIKINDNK